MERMILKIMSFTHLHYYFDRFLYQMWILVFTWIMKAISKYLSKQTQRWPSIFGHGSIKHAHSLDGIKQLILKINHSEYCHQLDFI